MHRSTNLLGVCLYSFGACNLQKITISKKKVNNKILEKYY